MKSMLIKTSLGHFVREAWTFRMGHVSRKVTSTVSENEYQAVGICVCRLYGRPATWLAAAHLQYT